MKNTNIFISIKNLSKHYKTKRENRVIFKDFSLQIYEKDRLGILGKNGVGKTTLANIIIGKTRSDGGIVEINDLIADKMESFGYLPQEFAFPEFFTPNDILNLVKSDLKRKNCLDLPHFESVVNTLEIEPIRKRRYKKLSGGEKQKINLASVLLYKPKVLILDEFTSNIDIETSFKIRRMLESINATIIVISHNAKEISEICNRLIFLKDGQIFRELIGRENISEKLILKTFSDMN